MCMNMSFVLYYAFKNLNSIILKRIGVTTAMKIIHNLHTKITTRWTVFHQYCKNNLTRYHKATRYVYKPCSTHRNVTCLVTNCYTNLSKYPLLFYTITSLSSITFKETHLYTTVTVLLNIYTAIIILYQFILRFGNQFDVKSKHSERFVKLQKVLNSNRSRY